MRIYPLLNGADLVLPDAASEVGNWPAFGFGEGLREVRATSDSVALSFVRLTLGREGRESGLRVRAGRR